MNKKKRFKHKWYLHIFFKYKVVEKPNCYEEYTAFRLWFIVVGTLLAIVFSPIIVIVYIIKENLILDGLSYHDKGDYITYTIYDKEVKNND